MKNVVIDKEKILDLIRNQFIQVINQNLGLYSDITLIIDDELQFTKLKDKEEGAIYIAVKFSSVSFEYGETNQEITMTVISEQNRIDIAQLLLMEYVTKYNLKLTNNGQILQGYTTPSVSSNFNYVYDGFRSILYVSGTFLISEDALRMKIQYHSDEIKKDDKHEQDGVEDVEAIAHIVSFDNQLDPQAFYRTHNFTESVAKVATFTFSMTMFLVSNLKIIDDALSLMFAEKSNNTSFNITVSIGTHSRTSEFRLANAQINQEPTSLSTITMTFSN